MVEEDTVLSYQQLVELQAKLTVAERLWSTNAKKCCFCKKLYATSGLWRIHSLMAHTVQYVRLEESFRNPTPFSLDAQEKHCGRSEQTSNIDPVEQINTDHSYNSSQHTGMEEIASSDEAVIIPIEINNNHNKRDRPLSDQRKTVESNIRKSRARKERQMSVRDESKKVTQKDALQRKEGHNETSEHYGTGPEARARPHPHIRNRNKPRSRFEPRQGRIHFRKQRTNIYFLNRNKHTSGSKYEPPPYRQVHDPQPPPEQYGALSESAPVFPQPSPMHGPIFTQPSDMPPVFPQPIPMHGPVYDAAYPTSGPLGLPYPYAIFRESPLKSSDGAAPPFIHIPAPDYAFEPNDHQKRKHDSGDGLSNERRIYACRHANIKCKYFPHCMHNKCPFLHPLCPEGIQCPKNMNDMQCPFDHGYMNSIDTCVVCSRSREDVGDPLPVRRCPHVLRDPCLNMPYCTRNCLFEHPFCMCRNPICINEHPNQIKFCGACFDYLKDWKNP